MPKGNEPRISVLMPAYNTGAYLREAIKSILEQTLTDFELIIVDDGSSDDTLAIAKHMAIEDSRIRLYSRPNHGVVSTRNELVAYARGELIAWADSDDVSEPTRLEVQEACFREQHDLVSLGGSLLLIDAGGCPLALQHFPHELTRDKHMCSPQTDSPFGASMMRTKAVRAVGGFRHPFSICEDFDLQKRLIEKGSMRNLPEVLIRYRQHTRNITSYGNLGAGWMTYYSIVMELAEERRSLGSDRLQRGEEIIIPRRAPETTRPHVIRTQVHSAWARRAKANGFARSAIKHAALSILSAPFSPIGWRALAHIIFRPRTHQS